MYTKKSKGFTLIEVVVVVLIISILAAIAISAYGRYSFRARRADGREFAMRIVQAEERFYTNFNRYTPTLGAGGLGFTGGALSSERNYYDGAVAVAADGQSFTVTVTPKDAQASDDCGWLSITNMGAKASEKTSTNGSCW
ncbi:type IV pilin protein [Tahibacter amnicola]|uniref:Type IV pilin protein n=1 Tax=Tahibacter amnicola TaxID=2976241 RepID=A0ABY6BBW0_9GAMM|nr:type IV pilin protein [Tahibacter amnicola]UXI67179.1 type IV pilin protein [Tahibacter amnicola]